jgi:outer membrane lipoprotein-sorting protein
MTKILRVLAMTACVIIFSFLANPLFSQNADKLLADATEKMKAHQSVNMEFTYQMFNAGAGINETTEGTALLSGDAYRLEIAGQLIISDGKTIWTVLTDAQEVQVNDAEGGEDAFSPTNMLTDYKENYNAKLKMEINELNGKDVYLLELIPREVKNFEKVNLFLLRDDLQPFRIELFDFNESVYKYTVNSFEAGKELPESTFEFSTEEFPDFDVIDMR